MKQFLLLIDGPMGSGKTTVSAILHEKVKNTAHIGLDRIKWFVSGFKRNKAQNTMTRAVGMAMTKEYLRQGINVIVEQGMRKETIKKYERVAKNHKVNFFVYQLNIPKEVSLERVKQRLKEWPRKRGKPVTPSRILRNYRIHLENKDNTFRTFDSTKLTARQIALKIFKDLNA